MFGQAKKNSMTVMMPVLASSIALLLSACDNGGGGVVTGKVAPRSATGEAVYKCASEKLTGAPSALQAKDKIKVCRLTEKDSGEMSTEAKDTEITPRFYTFGKKGRFRILQIVATDTKQNDTVNSETKLENERLVNAFLGEKCGPSIERVFKRASLDTKVIYRSLRDADRMSGSSSSKDSGSAESLFAGEGGRSVEGRTDAGKTAQVDIGAMDINFILKLSYSAKEGLSIRDEVAALSSGPLQATGEDAENNQLAFCDQVLMRVSENMGLGEGRDCASREAALKAAAEAGEAKLEKVSVQGKTQGKTALKKQMTVGISKTSNRHPQDLKSLRLADDEVSSIVKPICGDLKSSKKLPKSSDSKQS